MWCWITTVVHCYRHWYLWNYLCAIFYSALTEAQDINLHLKPLKNHFEDLEQAEFDEAHKLFPPILHVICLVWANSDYYNTPGRIVVLLQEMCNLLINMVRHF